MVGYPEQRIRPGVDRIDGPPFGIAVKGGLQEGLTEGGDEVGAGDREETEGDPTLFALPAEEVFCVQPDGREQTEAGPDAAGDEGLPGGDMGELRDGRAQHVPEVVVVHGRGGAGEVK